MSKIVKMIPNAITAMNLVCGVLGVVAVLAYGSISYAFALMLCAAVFDFLDGLAARLLKAYSEIGKQLDSLSDLVSFGVLPAFMMFAITRYCHGPIKLAPFIFVVFAAFRLAKFNCDDRQHDSFLGLPVPAAAIIAGALCHVIAFYQIYLPVRLPWTMPLVALVLGILMVSEIPMFAMKFGGGAKADKKTAFKRIAFLAVLVATAVATPLLGLAWSVIPLAGFSFYVLLNVAVR